VEGPRDALVTIRNGMMSLSILGSNNWTPRCVKLVLAIAPAIVLLLMDPDDAGQRASRRIYHDLSPQLRVVPVLLPHKFGVRQGKRVMLKQLDPGDLSRAQLRRICQRVGVEPKE
jgi:Toprim domain-containing protein